MENIGSALVVTVIGMGVIFGVLAALLLVIYVMNALFPYVAPVKTKPAPIPPKGEEEEVVAVIHAALSRYLQRDPGKITIRKG
jgi:sodium pump decarboxylase gamma subunit